MNTHYLLAVTISQALNHLYSLIGATELWAGFVQRWSEFPRKQQPQMVEKEFLRASAWVRRQAMRSTESHGHWYNFSRNVL